MKYIHYLPGGGLGDVFREAIYHNAVGILKRWKLENPQCRLKVLIMSHNPASADLLTGQGWIDELTQVRFPIEKTWQWEAAYTEYAKEFEGYTELRFNLGEARSLYASQFNRNRPKRPAGQLEYIEPIGTLWEPRLLTCEERAQVADFGQRIVVHPFAGQQRRSMPDALVHWLQEETTPLVVGAEYARHEHGMEYGTPYSPRVLYHGLRKARAVVGTESSVWYLATMLGVPAAMCYAPGETYDQVQQGKNTWNWYFGERNASNAVFRLPDAAGLPDWLQTYR